jgi:type IV secretion system protein VirB1
VIAAALLACAANVAAPTLEAIIAVESRGDALALHVNGVASQPPRPRAAKQAARLAEVYIEAGYSVDLGLMQVNSSELAFLGYTVEQVLDPCTNIRAGGRILASEYSAAAHVLGVGQPALQAALSAYNTGNFERGFANGYVARYYRASRMLISAEAITKVRDVKRASPEIRNPYTADIALYVREQISFEIR